MWVANRQRDSAPGGRACSDSLLALGVVGVFAMGLNAFLAVYQRLLNAPADQPTPAASAEPGDNAAMPVFVVPEDDTGRTATPPSEAPDGTAKSTAPQTPEPASR